MKTIAIVTGASSGMGRDFVYELVKEECLEEIWAIARRGERLEEIQRETYGKLRIFPLDLTRMEAFDELRNALEHEKPLIKYLVNAAGAGRMGRVAEIPYEEHAFVVDLNVRALSCMTVISLPYMKKGCCIIEMCSGSAFLPQPGFASYAASKAYVLSFTRALRSEVKNRHISVTAVCPGPVKTEFFEAAGASVAPLKRHFMADSKNVVRLAFKDAKAGRELSIYGRYMRVIRIFSRILPTRFLITIMNHLL